MIRRLFTACAALSLLVFIVVAILAVLGDRIHPKYFRVGGLELVSWRDVIIADWESRPYRGMVRVKMEWVSSAVGFGTYGDPDGGSYRSWVLNIKHWLLMLIAVPAPAAWGIARLARQRTRSGICRQCGYDLRATPDRCPECGTPAEHACNPV